MQALGAEGEAGWVTMVEREARMMQQGGWAAWRERDCGDPQFYASFLQRNAPLCVARL